MKSREFLQILDLNMDIIFLDAYSKEILSVRNKVEDNTKEVFEKNIAFITSHKDLEDTLIAYIF